MMGGVWNAYLERVESASERGVVLGMEEFKVKHLARRFFPCERCKVLDVGVGKGFHALFLKRQGHAVFGVDVADYYRERLGRLGIPFFKVDVSKDRLPFDDDFFDVVFASHVLEHLTDPFHFLSECGRVLRSGGVVVSVLPDVERFGFKFFDDPTHVRLFTKEGLRRLFLMCGFDVVWISNFELPKVFGLGFLKVYKLFPVLFYAGRSMLGVARKGKNRKIFK